MVAYIVHVDHLGKGPLGIPVKDCLYWVSLLAYLYRMFLFRLLEVGIATLHVGQHLYEVDRRLKEERGPSSTMPVAT